MTQRPWRACAACRTRAWTQRAPSGSFYWHSPMFRRRLRLGAMTALDQRVGLRFVAQGLEATECGAYIAHHLSLCGRSDTLFSDDAVALIYQVARGLPRAVNNLATQALVAAFSSSKAIVDESAARQAVAEVTAE